jgi:hypothetical protein
MQLNVTRRSKALILIDGKGPAELKSVGCKNQSGYVGRVSQDFRRLERFEALPATAAGFVAHASARRDHRQLRIHPDGSGLRPDRCRVVHGVISGVSQDGVVITANLVSVCGKASSTKSAITRSVFNDQNPEQSMGSGHEFGIRIAI